MSSLAALSAPNQNTKPGSILYSETLICKNMTVSGTQAIQNLEVKNNLLVDGYINTVSDQETSGTLYMNSLFPTSIALPVGTNGGYFTFSSTLGKVVHSGLVAANSASASTNGSTFAQLLTPFANPYIVWMPNLNLFTGIDIIGTAVYTSPTAVNGSWVIGTPAASNFNIDSVPFYSSIYQKVYMGNTQVGSRVYSTSNGSLYSPCAATRFIFSMDQAPASSGLGTGNGRIVAVGSEGPSYSDDGSNFLPSNSTIPMHSVAWSPFWSMFVGIVNTGTTSVYISTNGIDWTTVTNAYSPGVSGQKFIIWVNQLQLFVSGGDLSQFHISKDGRSWRRLFGTVPGLIAYGGIYIKEWGQFMSGGLGTVIAASSRKYFN